MKKQRVVNVLTITVPGPFLLLLNTVTKALYNLWSVPFTEFPQQCLFSGTAIPMGSLIWNSYYTVHSEKLDWQPGRFFQATSDWVGAIPSLINTCYFSPVARRFLRLWMGCRGRDKTLGSWKDLMSSSSLTLFPALSIRQALSPWHSRPPWKDSNILSPWSRIRPQPPLPKPPHHTFFPSRPQPCCNPLLTFLLHSAKPLAGSSFLPL